MAAPNIVYLPGIFGSSIGQASSRLHVAIPVWVSPLTATTGLLLQLQLAADGVSPGPKTWGIPLVAYELLESTYGPMGRWMRGLGWNVIDAFYDWRLSVLVSGAHVLAQIQAAIGQQPFVCVCHSMGGLIARVVYALLLIAGQGQQVQGIVTMGTPHFGSWEMVRGFFGLPYLYQKLNQIAGLFSFASVYYRPDFLDLILASWPGWYELGPWRDAGPLAINNPAVARSLYQLGTYAGGNQYVTQPLLDAAAATQDFLAPAFPPGLMRCIRGNHFSTPNMVNPPNPLNTDAGYQFVFGGDGTVPIDYATVVGATNADVTAFHGNMPLDPHVWAAVRWCVQTLLGPGA